MSVTVRRYRHGGWEVDIVWRAPDGRRRRERQRLTMDLRSTARRWGEARERELLVNGPAVRKEVPTFGAFWPRFLDGYARANRQKPSGIAAKETIGRVPLQPHFGTKRLDAITTEQVQRLKHALTNRAPKTVNNVMTVLNVVLRKAVEWNVLERMPCTIRLLPIPTAPRLAAVQDFVRREPSLEREVSACERAARRTLQVPLEAGCSLFVGELDHHRDRPRPIPRGGWSEPPIVRVEPLSHVCSETDLSSLPNGEAAEDVDVPLVHAKRCASSRPSS